MTKAPAKKADAPKAKAGKDVRPEEHTKPTAEGNAPEFGQPDGSPLVKQDNSDKDPDAYKEVAQRTRDTDVEHSDAYVIAISAGFRYDSSMTEADYVHEANATSVITDCINAGLRPTGPAEYVGAEPDPQSPETRTLLTYSVPVLPAHDVEVVVTPHLVPVDGPGVHDTDHKDGH